MKITRIRTAYKIAGIFIAMWAVVSCKKNETPPAQLTVGNITDTIPEGGGTVALKFTTNAAWHVDTAGLKWLHLSQTSGNGGNVSINLTAAANSSGMSRSLLLNLVSTNGQSRRITVWQNAWIYPSYNTSPKAPDATGMGSTAVQLNANIKLGWNIWNTMDAPGWETGWGQPKITQHLIDLVKSTGMNAIRLPCTWSNHIIDKKTWKIDPLWLARVKEVVQYCINDNMYVMLNTHHETYLDCTVTGALQDTVNARHKAVWQQIATTMRDFDEHLMFASANEPNGTDAPTTNTLMRYHQSFIDAVRSTGGKNTYRTLIIQAPSTSIDLATQYLSPGNVYKYAQLPVDPTPKKMILEIHYYAPPNFAILGADASWGKEWYFWGAGFHTTNPLFLDRNSTTSTEESLVNSEFHSLKANFVDKGIPVIMGEYDAAIHADKLVGYKADSLLSVNSRMHFFRYLTQQAKANGVAPFLWGGGIINRPAKDGIATGPEVISDQRALDSLKRGAGL
ncbi:MAG TPA: cellulase family glycosylhydrolase [Mucilaginibacter sp.]